MLHALAGEPAEVRGSTLRVGGEERALGFCVKHAAFAGERALLGDGVRAYELGPRALLHLAFRYEAGPLFLTQHWAGYVDGGRLRLYAAKRELTYALPLEAPPRFATDGRSVVFYWPEQSHCRNFLVVLDERGPRTQRVALRAHHVAVDGPWLYVANKTKLLKLRLHGDLSGPSEWTWATERAASGVAADAGVLLLGPPQRLTAALGPDDELGLVRLPAGAPWAFYDGHVLWRDGDQLCRVSLVSLLESRRVAARLALRFFLPARAVDWVVRFL